MPVYHGCLRVASGTARWQSSLFRQPPRLHGARSGHWELAGKHHMPRAGTCRTAPATFHRSSTSLTEISERLFPWLTFVCQRWLRAGPRSKLLKRQASRNNTTTESLQCPTAATLGILQVLFQQNPKRPHDTNTIPISRVR